LCAEIAIRSGASGQVDTAARQFVNEPGDIRCDRIPADRFQLDQAIFPVAWIEAEVVNFAADDQAWLAVDDDLLVDNLDHRFVFSCR
jgi:hypothetical protein